MSDNIIQQVIGQINPILHKPLYTNRRTGEHILKDVMRTLTSLEPKENEQTY